METFHDNVNEYRKQLKQGAIKAAYRGLMEYIMGLRTYLKNKYPNYVVSGLYAGYMDMTYFSFFPKSLGRQKLKIALVFLHDTCRFEVWLAANNKQIQAKYWKLFQESGWDKYHLVPTLKGSDAIVEYALVGDPDFNNLEALTGQIERETLKFTGEIERFLSK